MSKSVLYNGKVYVERDVFAEAVYQENGIIKKVGSNEEVLAEASDAERIDCQGKTILPGLNDSHMHLLYLGKVKLAPDLTKSTCVEDMVVMCQDYLKENPECRGIFAMGWNQDKWINWDGRLPNRHDADRISTTIPVVLNRVCGHSSAVNTYVLEQMGLNKDNNTFEGGDVFLEEDGVTPNGYVCEKAAFMARDLVPQPTREEYKKAFIKAMDYAVSCGLTTVQSNDPGLIIENHDECYELFSEIYAEGSGKIRYTGQLSYFDPQSVKEYCEGTHYNESLFDDWLRRGPLKILKDGSLGARTAMMRHEYYDDPGNYGVETNNDAAIQAMVDVAQSHGMQVLTHCIGDDAIERTVRAYEKANGGVNNLRHSLVHCQITDRALLEYIKKTGTVSAFQPIFLEADLYAVESRCGKEMSSTSYAFKTAADMDIRASYGTDSPVDDCNPFPCIYTAVTRKDLEGKPEGGFYPEECVDVETAIDAYTIESAYHEFREDVKGRIKEGYYADMIVLDTDIFTCEPNAIKDIRPIMTMVGGKIVYQR